MSETVKTDAYEEPVDGMSRVVRVPTLLKQLNELCRKGFEKTGFPPAACWIQLDEMQGHREQVGFSGLEKLMHAVHERVRAQLHSADLSARFGLDSIGIVLDPDGGERDFRATGKALVKAVNNNLFEVDDHMIAATVSIAARRLREDLQPGELNLVDVATAAAEISARGGNRYETGSGADTVDQSSGSLLAQLTKALKDNTIKVVFQPLLATTGPERERAQLLPRLTATDGSLIPAARFIPVAAERGVLPAVDHWMIAHAVSLLRNAVDHDEELPQYFLNQSPALLEDQKFVEWLSKQVGSLKKDQRTLVLEFSILDLKPRIREARSVLARLQKMGLSVSLTGIDEKVPETILLKHLPADYLRMSADFAHRLVEDEDLAERFDVFSESARKAGRRLIVPMLEDAEAVSKIWQMNVDLIQGNFIQQPSERLIDR